MADEKTLSAKQEAAVRSLLLYPSVIDAAAHSGVGERTLRRWLAEDDTFCAAVRSAQDTLLDGSVRALVGLNEAAVQTLKTVLDDPNEKTSNRLRAAQLVLDSTLRLVELRDLARRVAALEVGDSED